MIRRGQKVIELRLKQFKIIMRDTIAFIPGHLADFTKSFNLSEGEKGFFPHLLHTEDQRDYEGSFPAKKYFDPDGMVPKDRPKFEVWYQKEQERYSAGKLLYNLQEEMLRYCKQDVAILLKGAEKFRQIIFETSQLDVFLAAPTISSACNKIFRSSFMEEDSIAIISQHGLQPKKQQSKEALYWLAYMEQREGISIEREVNFLRTVFLCEKY